ncbi:MAG TPA: alpha/beta hydrolase [Candidatus Saccharimonadia bacterium]|jgi:pimeloyl-ACP methyl ester carboxylesterase|nr:alpha/beta hydrolase [Candidatus Saccharimonadia bacterium]
MSAGPYLLSLKRQGSGPLVVLIHGAAGGTLIWGPVAERLAGTHEVVSIDLLGYGDSPKPRIEYTLEAHTEAIHHTLAHHGITGPFAMAGLSMGCLLVLEYARRWPGEVKQLLCVGPPYFDTPDEARFYLRRSFNARMALERPTAARLAMGPVWKAARHSRLLSSKFSRIYTPEMTQQSMQNTFQAFRSSLIHCMVEVRYQPLLDATKAIRQDYLYGELDRYVPLDHIRSALEKLPNASLEILPNIGHNPVVIAPGDTAAWMLSKLAIPARSG